MSESEPWIVEQQWNLTYRHSTDEVTATFFRALRDERKLLGIRCPKCERVLVPPRAFCDRDFCRTEGWVELGEEGTIELFTIVYQPVKGLPEPPYVVAYVRPDGADTALVNFLGGLDLSDRDAVLDRLAIGVRARIEFRDERVGRMTDFEFRLAEKGGAA
jgi:uncharacterized OB-fold protein